MEEQKFTQGDEGLDVVDEADEDEIKMSPPDNRSEQSYELFVKHPPDRGETKDQLSVFSEEPDDNISDSDYEANNGRTNSRLRHRRVGCCSNTTFDGIDWILPSHPYLYGALNNITSYEGGMGMVSVLFTFPAFKLALF